ncbi:hypothetical protein GCM10010965_28520 [Caldalkalibacillus thermarum]|uniref:hypothetical protein n=1 Tax=Caldalkalibacillus thermarum TaxID=296745 RepID=UPI0016664626|nr:hypothetical protein [Caldalkalibacillus thermarum]GGK33920.1 hypothetical protein GCM10010965_28520 [Caldalkalibacillus thermarum]
MSIRPMSAKTYRRLLNVSLRKEPATAWFKDVCYLNVYTGQVEKGHIYLAGERIAYVGDQEPLVDGQTMIIELDEEQVLVPGYIEPHAHPFQCAGSICGYGGPGLTVKRGRIAMKHAFRKKV